MKLVVGVGQSGNGHAFSMVGGVNKLVVSSVYADVRNSALIGVLEENKVSGAKIAEMNRLS